MTTRKPEKTKELQVIKAAFCFRVEQRLGELGMSASELASATGNPRSTISELLSPENMRLPSVPSLINIARALSGNVSDLLPDHLLSVEVEFHKSRRSFFPHGLESLRHTVDLISKYSLRSGISYHPRTIPEFLKSPEILATEMNLPMEGVTQYASALSSLRDSRLSGILILDETVLETLVDRKGIYEGLSRQGAIDAVQAIRKFESEHDSDITLRICDRLRHQIDPILILSDSIAISDYFGSLLLVTDSDLISSAKEKFIGLRGSGKSLGDWLKAF
jgi:transcriptional regulator with XRE-family HTH domain